MGRGSRFTVAKSLRFRVPGLVSAKQLREVREKLRGLKFSMLMLNSTQVLWVRATFNQLKNIGFVSPTSAFIYDVPISGLDLTGVGV